MLGKMTTPMESLPDEEETEDRDGTETNSKEDSPGSSRKSWCGPPSPDIRVSPRLPKFAMGKLERQRIENTFIKVTKVKE